jgi:putative ATPase
LHNRDAIFALAAPARQGRVLIPAANDGLLLWESLRRCPEGLTAALVNTQTAKDALLRYAQTLDEAEKPLIAVTDELLPSPEQCEEWFSCSVFDHILIRSARLTAEPSQIAACVKPLLAKSGSLVLFFSPPRFGERISRILADECETGELAAKLEQAEKAFFGSTDVAGFWDEAELAAAFEKQGFSVTMQTVDQNEERLITEKDLAAWFNAEQSRWGSFMAKTLEEKDFASVEQALRVRIAKGPVRWYWKSICLRADIF